METVTIACPPGYTDPNVNAETAPIWLDSNGIEYLIASGPIEGYATSDPIEATPIRVSVVVGMDGLDALAAMGLTVKEDEI